MILELTEADKEEIQGLIKAYYKGLVNKDREGTLRFYETVAAEEAQIKPELVEFHREVMNDSLDKLFASSEFKMKPLLKFGVRE